jgi:hypothetical protein
MSTISITKKYELLHRKDGVATYECVDESGTELLIVSPNGSMLHHMIAGFVRDPLPTVEPVTAPLPAIELADDDHVPEPVSAPVPVRDPLPRSGPVRIMPAVERLPPVKDYRTSRRPGLR